jgi:hypothetical protein
MTTTPRWRTALSDAVDLIALVWVIPVAILAVGAPIALVGALAVWVGRLIRHAF